MTPQFWKIVRILFIAFWVVAGLGNGLQQRPLAVAHLVFFLILGALQTRFLLIRSYKKLPDSVVWLKPSWTLNPFLLNQPLQFFHLFGYSIVLFSLSSFIRKTIELHSLPPDIPVEFLAGAWGLGILLGIQWSLYSFRTKFKNHALTTN